MLGQTHVNGWSCVIASQNGCSTSYIFPFKLGFYNGVATYLIIGKIRKPKLKNSLFYLFEIEFALSIGNYMALDLNTIKDKVHDFVS